MYTLSPENLYRLDFRKQGSGREFLTSSARVVCIA